MSDGLNVEQCRRFVVRPALYALEPVIRYSVAAERQTLGTGMTEGNLQAIKQYGRGPALGLFQMEEATHESLWVHSIPGIKGLAIKLTQMLGANHMIDDKPWPAHEALVTNLLYAAAMCRVRYYIVRQRLPLENDPVGMAVYWRQFYNAGGDGTVDRALPFFIRATKEEPLP